MNYKTSLPTIIGKPVKKTSKSSRCIYIAIVIVWILVSVVIVSFGISFFYQPILQQPNLSSTISNNVSNITSKFVQNSSKIAQKTSVSAVWKIPSSQQNSNLVPIINFSSSSKDIFTISSIVIPINSSSSSNLAISSTDESSKMQDNASTKKYSGLDFQDIYENTKYDKVIQDNTKPAIFIEETQQAKNVNKHIQAIAENRGYKRRLQAIESELIPVDGQRLQSESRDAWLLLKQNAKKEGINLILVSGYRSVMDQKNLFINDLAPTYNPENILNGSVDIALNNIMDTRSIPGYSRHHTGYTMDFGCDSGELLTFKETACYDWIKKNNFAQAKKVGLIPSYPAGVPKQGPKPEEWEFVWVGKME